METIMRSFAIQLINTNKPFDLEFVTADRRRGTGGELIKVENWKKVSKQSAKEEKLTSKTFSKFEPDVSKNPHHFLNDTFNIFNPANRSDHPRKVHYWLMISLNGKTIING